MSGNGDDFSVYDFRNRFSNVLSWMRLLSLNQPMLSLLLVCFCNVISFSVYRFTIIYSFSFGCNMPFHYCALCASVSCRCSRLLSSDCRFGCTRRNWCRMSMAIRCRLCARVRCARNSNNNNKIQWKRQRWQQGRWDRFHYTDKSQFIRFPVGWPFRSELVKLCCFARVWHKLNRWCSLVVTRLNAMEKGSRLIQ